jgi:hypothetical protein
LYQWLQTIEVDPESNPYGFVVEAELRTVFLPFCHRTPELASSYLQSFGDRKHADETRLSILQFRGTLAQAAPKQLADFAIDTLIDSRKDRNRRHSGPLHFGLGEATRAVVDIRWPSGIVQNLEEVSADQRLDVAEPTA